MELWDAYDAHLNVIAGQVLVRGEKIKKSKKKSWWDVGSDCWWFSFARRKSLRVCQTRIA